MEFIWAIIIGLIAGAIAKLLMPGKDPGGFIITALLGIAGSLLATFVGRMLGWYDGNDGAGGTMHLAAERIFQEVGAKVKAAPFVGFALPRLSSVAKETSSSCILAGSS